MKWLILCLLLVLPQVAHAQAGDILDGLSKAVAGAQRGVAKRHGTSSTYWWVVQYWQLTPVAIVAGPYGDAQACGGIRASLERVLADIRYTYACVSD